MHSALQTLALPDEPSQDVGRPLQDRPIPDHVRVDGSGLLGRGGDLLVVLLQQLAERRDNQHSQRLFPLGTCKPSLEQ
jgi:hypothetical protein